MRRTASAPDRRCGRLRVCRQPPLLQGRDRWPGVRHQLAGCSRVATPPEWRHRTSATASSSRSQHLPSASSCCTGHTHSGLRAARHSCTSAPMGDSCALCRRVEGNSDEIRVRHRMRRPRAAGRRCCVWGSVVRGGGGVIGF